MTCKYFVDKDSGKYLGGFSGHYPVVDDVKKIPVTKKLPVKTPEGKVLLDAKGNEIEEVVHYTVERVVGIKKLDMVYPEFPAGGIEVSAPPRHGWDTYDHKKKEWIAHDSGERYPA